MSFQKELTASLQRNGDRIAVVTDTHTITYSEILSKSEDIAACLLSNGLKKETIVGVMLDKREDIINSMIGIMNAGCVVVLIDGSLPQNRLQAILHELKLEYIISDRASFPNTFIERFPGICCFLLEDIIGRKRGETFVYPQYNEEDSLYIYFTSGSTGKPKGIIGKNCSLLHFIKWEIAEFNINDQSRSSQFITPYFDAFLRDVFVPLFAGGTICVSPAGKDFFETEKMIAWINANKITLIHCVPGIFRVFNSTTLSASDFTSLQHILLSGEKIIPAELSNWYKKIGDRVELVNLYGPTETTMIRTFYRITPSDVNQARIPVGTPIADTEILITRNNWVPCKTLVQGEVYIISKYTTKGYLNAPELTAQKFIRYITETGEEKIAFKTGDVARMLPNGLIDLLGREDRQVKIRGIRVELDEIEQLLVQSPFIQNAVVVHQTPQPGSDLVIAFVIKNRDLPHKTDFIGDVWQYAKDNIPEYMMPSEILEVQAYPLLPNGKINYNELLSRLQENTITAPADETEEKLMTVWKDILGGRVISTQDSFLRVGGNSLSIMRLISRIYSEFNVRIPLQEIFVNLNIQKQADLIKKAKKENILAISKAEQRNGYNLSSAQDRMYYLYEMDPLGIVYNMPMVWEIKHAFDKDKISNTLRSLIDRHESLRTGFVTRAGKVQQVVHDSVDFEMEEIICETDIDAAIARFVRPFDLSKAPLFRCGIVYAKDRTLLIADMHHIVADGLSQKILYEDFLSLYRSISPEALPIQYKDYAVWENELKVTEEYVRYREYWLKSFEGEIPVLALPVANWGSGGVSNEGREMLFRIDNDIVNRISAALRNEEVTSFSGLFALFFLFLSRLTGQDDIVIGVSTSGRMQQELERIVGMFVKTLPVRCKLNPNLSFREYAKVLHHEFVQAGSNQLYDLSDIISELNKKSAEPVKNLFEVMFVYRNYENNTLPVEENAFSFYEMKSSIAKFPLMLTVEEGNGEFNFRMEYSLQHFTPADIAILIEQFTMVVNRASKNINGKVIDIMHEDASLAQIAIEDIDINI
jgi:mycobactin peptide synthetase MbtE